jgi:hypothetical protein
LDPEQDRVDRFEPGRERFDFGLGDPLAAAMVFLKSAIRRSPRR